MNLTRKYSEDYITFASVVNEHCDDFKLSELSTNNFKCLIFVQGLVSVKDAEIRRRVLNKLENEPKSYSLTNSGRLSEIRKCTPRFEKHWGIWHNTHKKGTIKEKKQSNSPTKSNQFKKKHDNLAPNPCSGCGSLHGYKDCSYWNKKKCLTSSRVGHKNSHCRTRKKG